MNRVAIAALVVAALFALAAAPADSPTTGDEARRHSQKAVMNKRIAAYVAARQAEFAQIDAPRKSQLDELAAFLRAERAADRLAQLLFVCTHNSRRSHIAQLWAAVAAETYGVRLRSYSGGTESTAFNPRAVAALERAGFQIEKTTDDANPVYHVRFSADRPPITCFSKKYDNAPNPRKEFAAVMVCDDADKACPTVPGAAARFALPFIDPRRSDDTPREAATYDERCAQIARELLYVCSRAAQ